MSILMLLCPLGMAAMGGVAWVLTRLPGKRTGLARVARRSTCLPACLPVGASESQPADEGPERAGSVSNV
jgi:hypothetical protein